jgi:hypothetical protein
LALIAGRALPANENAERLGATYLCSYTLIYRAKSPDLTLNKKISMKKHWFETARLELLALVLLAAQYCSRSMPMVRAISSRKALFR